ncbi:MAG: HAMP domain-containing sensor histidine kinase [Bacteroidota bacterium]|nr:HAMP domain-containing sensor histidine kinase [Bacteroidota bacterium]
MNFNKWFKKLNSFRARIVGGFLFFVLLLLGISVQIYWVRSEEQHLKQLENQVSYINSLVLQLYKAENDFFTYELINPDFFRNKKSDFLKVHTQEVNEIDKNITSLIQNNRTTPEMDTELYKAKSILNTHIEIFNEIIQLQLKRGFKDYGYEGEMRNNIHAIEHNYPEFDQTILLTFRRIEKDYLLRKDTAYREKMRKYYFLNKDNFYGNNIKRQTKIRKYLNSYYLAFNKIVDTEEIIGVQSNKGLRSKLSASFNQLEISLKRVSIWSEKFSTDYNYYLFKVLQFTIISALIIAILLTIFLSKIITKPIEKLTIYVLKASKYGINSVNELKSTSDILEVKLLEDKFHLLANEIKKYVDDVNDKNQKLEKINSELISLNHLLESTNKKLQLSEDNLKNSIRVKERFLALISHDIRGPLATLKGFLSILSDHPDLITEKERKKMIGNIKDSVDQQLTLLSNLMNWARSQMGEIRFSPEAVSPKDVADTVTHLYTPTADEKEISLINLIDPNAVVWADKNMLELIIRNLVSNSIKFTPRKGKVMMTSEIVGNKSELCIRIIDSGVGISQENIDKILNEIEHVTTLGTNQEKGTGFGLSFCKQFVELNGGRLSIISNINKGTEVSFTMILHKHITDKVKDLVYQSVN